MTQYYINRKGHPMVEPHDDQNRETSFTFGSTIEQPSIWLHILIFAITLSAVLITILLALIDHILITD